MIYSIKNYLGGDSEDIEDLVSHLQCAGKRALNCNGELTQQLLQKWHFTHYHRLNSCLSENKKNHT